MFGLIYCQGTSGDSDSDFAAAQELMYNPLGYNMQEISNIYDKEGQGRQYFVYFFPGYLNRKGCYNSNGVSDVTKALLEILKNRYVVKYNSTDLNAITKTISEVPITPQEAIIRTTGNIFPVTELTNRLNQIDGSPNFFDDVYVGELIFNKDKEVEFKISNDLPIRDFPTKDNKVQGAIEIYAMPEKVNNEIPTERYITYADPYDDDSSNTMSLGSVMCMDLWTDTIVAEYTGRPMYADDFFEIVRKLTIFYHAKCCYEAHPYDQIVRLPDGSMKKWEDIKIGDSLLSPDGSITKVVDIPMDGVDDIYKITLVDGRSVEASSNHKWVVYTIRDRINTKEFTTKELYNNGIINNYNQHKYYIPDNTTIDYPYKETPIDPYTLGLLIAEGAFTKFKKTQIHKSTRRFIQVSSSMEDAEFYKTVIPYEMKHIGTKGYSWHLFIDNIDKKLESLGLLHHYSYTKFIPELYLYNSKEVRLELLKGIMDGDGHAGKGASILVTTSETLAKDICLLCRSLGIKASYKKAKESTEKTKAVYNVSICADKLIFKLPRKANNQHVYTPNNKGSKASGFLHKTAIHAIEYVGKKQCKCVTVDNPNGLYLIGDYITTHNCNKKGLFAYFSRYNCLYLLADTPEYLRDKQLIKEIGYGNKSKGIMATVPIKKYGLTLIRDWLLKPYTKIETNSEGQEEEITLPNLYRLKNRALIKELILWNPDINVDRIMALVQGVLYREEKMILYQGDLKSANREMPKNYGGNDDFFTRNYDNRFKNKSKIW